MSARAGVSRGVRLLSDRIGAASRAQHVAFRTTGVFSWTSPESGVAIIRLFGAGGAGFYAGTDVPKSGGGGGAYCEKIVELQAGDIISGTVGAGINPATSTPVGKGGDTTATVRGLTLTAGGGTHGAQGTPGAGGVASGGDVNNAGGAGASRNSQAAAGVGTSAGSGGSTATISQSGGAKAGGGAGGPNTSGPIFGGRGGNAVDGLIGYDGEIPGGGGASAGNAPKAGSGANGLVMIEFYPGASL